MTKIQCGTDAGYQRHRRAGEVPCDRCREAHRLFMADYRKHGSERQARRRALDRLAAENPNRFVELLRDERK